MSKKKSNKSERQLQRLYNNPFFVANGLSLVENLASYMLAEDYLIQYVRQRFESEHVFGGLGPHKGLDIKHKIGRKVERERGVNPFNYKSIGDYVYKSLLLILILMLIFLVIMGKYWSGTIGFSTLLIAIWWFKKTYDLAGFYYRIQLVEEVKRSISNQFRLPSQ